MKKPLPEQLVQGTLTFHLPFALSFAPQGEPSPQREVTLVVEDKSWSNVSYFRVGYAICAENDNFCRRTGRLIAARRLKRADQVIEGSAEAVVRKLRQIFDLTNEFHPNRISWSTYQDLEQLFDTLDTSLEASQA